MRDPRALFHAAFTRNTVFLIHLATDLNRDTSPSFMRSLDVARTFFGIYNPRKPAIIIIPHLESARLTQSSRFGKSYSYPQDSFESARYLESARLPNATDSRHGFSSIEPQPSIVRHNFGPSVVVLLQSSRDSPDFCGFVGCDTRASSPLFSSSSLDVLCPFVGLLVYGHRPF